MSDKLVCLKSFKAWNNQEPPMVGKFYTFDGLDERKNFSWWKSGFIFLAEYTELNVTGHRPSFLSSAFRPLTPLEAWNESEQEAYLEYIEHIAPGIETETLIEK